MAYRIIEECIACGACIPECPERCFARGGVSDRVVRAGLAARAWFSRLPR